MSDDAKGVKLQFEITREEAAALITVLPLLLEKASPSRLEALELHLEARIGPVTVRRQLEGLNAALVREF